MYLADRELRQLLPALDVQVENEAFPFSADDQLQPCSMDLRLSQVFWLPTGNSTIDLRRSHLLEVSPRKNWKRTVLKPNGYITLKPGKILLGRTCEQFTMPPEYVGEIEGRSSFSRMGLAVQCTGAWVQPGWRGHIPLQLINHGPNPVKVFPYIPICQLKVVTLSSKPERLYGDDGLQNKYQDDDGGPSFWWRDKRIRSLQKMLGQIDISMGVQEELVQSVRGQSPEILDRLQQYVARLPSERIDNTETILEGFVRTEDRRRVRHQTVKFLLSALFPLLLSFSIGSLFQHPYGLQHGVLWLATALALPVTLFAGFQADFGEYFGTKEAWRLREQE